ncbi:hypothetical protein Q7689_09775 [Nocardiopsis tropica]|uniref:hypothetical protein n=1 Tax=Nocardiopsis tropica TaxID=109330 RepID=UPI002E8A9C37|nr:hypothetical protein [Nocardiopsis tropica]
MKAGDKLRFRGPAGASFVVTVGAAWTPRTIRARVASGEWSPREAPASVTVPTSPAPVAEAGPPARPSRTATRPAWTAWATAVHGLTQAQAEDMTKAQLMELPDTPPVPVPGTVGNQEQEAAPPLPPQHGRPAEDDPKTAWAEYAFRLGKGTREDLAVFTREDLIELTA